jgi:predicted RNase H-like nuclease (RuvC/YqgF family)
MKLYKCEHCDYETTYKGKLENHRKRKTPCYTPESNIDLNELVSRVKNLESGVETLKEDNSFLKSEVERLNKIFFNLSKRVLSLNRQINPPSPTNFTIEDEK